MNGPLAVVGYMGSGKSTVGRLVAGELGWQFVDLDVEIAVREKRPIPQIFRESGEKYFRDLESRGLAWALGGPSRLVVACGGGAVLHPENRRRLKEVATVFLEENLGVLYARTRGADRPLRGGSRESFERRYEERLPLYLEVARLRVRANGRTPEELAEEIVRWMKG
jgi:shikimate kinase